MKKILVTSLLAMGLLCPLPASAAASLPFSESFINSSALNSFTNLPGEGNKAWSFSYSGYVYASGTPCDSWLITPDFELSTGTAYQLSFAIKVDSSTPMSLNVTYGQGADIESQQTILFNESISSKSYETKTITFPVPADGIYYIGFHAIAASPGGTWLCLDDISFKAVEVAPLEPTNVFVTAAPEGLMEAIINWTNPTQNNLGATLDDNSLQRIEFYRTDSSYGTGTLIHTIERGTDGDSNFIPGAEVSWTDTSITKAGKYYYSIAVCTSEGSSKKVSAPVSPWIGFDSGVSEPKTVTVELLEDNTVKLTFADITGSNGGYVNLADVRYKITRAEGSSSTYTTIAEDIATDDLTFIDTTVKGLTTYKYRVYAKHKDTSSYPSWDYTTTDAITTGGTASIPYSEQFNSADNLNNFYTNLGSNKWSYYSGRIQNYCNEAGDAWLITPQFHLEAGKAYDFSFYAYLSRNLNESDYKTVKIFVGDTNVPADFERELLTQSIETTSSYNTVKTTFTVAQTGDYYIAIQGFANSDNSMAMLNIDNMVLNVIDLVPGTVEDFVAFAADKGEQKVTVRWTNPSLSNAGTELTEITKAEILRATSTSGSMSVVKTIETGLTPGETFETEDEPENAGHYYYSVRTYLGDKPSADAARVDAGFVGKDTAVNPASNVVATIVDENTVSLAFTPAAGKNGGYIDPEDISYRITRQAGSNAAVELVRGYQGGSPFIDEDVNEGLNSYVYSIYTTYNETENATAAKSNAVILGGTAPIPYFEDFGSNTNFNNLFTKYCEGNYGWSYNSSGYIYSGALSPDAWVFLPKFKLEAGKSYELSFDTWNESTSGNDKDLYVTIGKSSTVDGQDRELWHEVITGTAHQTIAVKISVAETDIYYIAFHCHGGRANYYVYLDNLSLDVNEEAPAKVEDLAVVAGADGAKTATASWSNPTVTNGGAELTQFTKVELYRDGEVIYTNDEPEAGAYESVEDSLETAGEHVYYVVSYLGEVASEPSDEVKVWIGADVPAAVANALAELSEDKTTVTITFDTLDPQTGGVNGGYIGEVTYRVVRMPDAKLIAEEIDCGPATDDNVDAIMLGTYYYEITAVGEELEGEAASTNALVLGVLTLEEGDTYAFDFSTADTFDNWVKLPEEGKTANWSYSKSDKQLESPFSDSSILTPEFLLYPGQYEMSFYAMSYNGSNEASLTTYVTTEVTTPKPETVEEPEIETFGTDGTMQVLNTRTIKSGLFEKFVDNFDITQPDRYRIGFRHNETSAMLPQIKLKDVALTAKVVTEVANVVVDNNGVAYDVNGDALITVPGTDVQIFSADGRMVLMTVSEGIVSLSGLGHGVYVARVGAVTFKFIK